MENQANRFKEAIVEVLLKRIIPLEKQLEWQSEVIDQLTQSLEALAKMLAISEEKSVKTLKSKEIDEKNKHEICTEKNNDAREKEINAEENVKNEEKSE